MGFVMKSRVVDRGIRGAAAALALTIVSVAQAREIEGDQFYVGNTTIRAQDTVKGNITIQNGTLTVLGVVEGNIWQLGAGDVDVRGGLVKGNIEESAGGVILVRAGGEVEGNLDEQGDGSVRVAAGSLVKGDVFESGRGAIVIVASTVEGNLDESEAGNVSVSSGSLIKGNLFESGAGSCSVSPDSEVEGNIECD